MGKKEQVLFCMTLNCIWWWGFSPGALRNVEQPLITITPRSTLIWIFVIGPGDLGSITGRVIPKTLKWYLIPPCLTLSNIRYVSRVKLTSRGKGVAPSPTVRCSSYWKGSLLVALDYGRQLYFTNSTCLGHMYGSDRTSALYITLNWVWWRGSSLGTLGNAG